jgi:Domain of unknown function (DUF4189)
MFIHKALLAICVATLTFWITISPAHAENGCPEGQIPVQNANDVAYTCTNIQDYEAAQRRPARPTIWVDVYSAVAWHPQVADVWAVWNVRNEQGSGSGAEQYALNACIRDMGEGCILAGSAFGGTIAVARSKDGTIRAAFGETGGKAKSKVMADCAIQKMQCTFLKSFSSKSWREFADSNSDERYDRMKIYTPSKAKIGVVKSSIAVAPAGIGPISAAPQTRFGAAVFNRATKSSTDMVWLSGGHTTYEAAKKTALSQCLKESGAGCFVFLINADGYILVGFDNEGIVRGNDGPSLEAAEADAKKLCGLAKITCQITVRFDVTKAETKTVNIMRGVATK